MHMMMVCPRCGFSQPADPYCAQCGLNISTFQPVKKSFLVRFFQNPNLHLFLIAALVVVVLGYIFYSQRDLLGKEVGEFLKDIPLLSNYAHQRGASDHQPPAATARHPHRVWCERFRRLGPECRHARFGALPGGRLRALVCVSWWRDGVSS